MKKVVINNCYGGFGLSNVALKRLVELTSSKTVYFYEQTKHNFRNDGENEYRKISENKSVGFFTHPMLKDLGEVVTKLPNDYYLSTWELVEDRSNPLLIQVIEELGTKANGQCSLLKIVEIPDGVEYEIDDYDGMESIEEAHRSWN